MSLKNKQNKIPEFFREKGKDIIVVMDYIRQINDLAWENRWPEEVSYHHFLLELGGQARE